MAPDTQKSILGKNSDTAFQKILHDLLGLKQEDEEAGYIDFYGDKSLIIFFHQKVTVEHKLKLKKSYSQ